MEESRYIAHRFGDGRSIGTTLEEITEALGSMAPLDNMPKPGELIDPTIVILKVTNRLWEERKKQLDGATLMATISRDRIDSPKKKV